MGVPGKIPILTTMPLAAQGRFAGGDSRPDLDRERCEVNKVLTASRLPAVDGSEEAPAMAGGETGAARSASASTPAQSSTMRGPARLGELW